MNYTKHGTSSNLMGTKQDTTLPAHICPIVSVGDTVQVDVFDREYYIEHHGMPEKYDEITTKVTGYAYNEYQQGACLAFKHLKLIKCDNGKMYNPGNTNNVDCRTCPLVLRHLVPSQYHHTQYHHMAGGT